MSKFDLMNGDEIKPEVEVIVLPEAKTIALNNASEIIFVNTGLFLLPYTDIIRARGINICDHMGLIRRVNPIVVPAIDMLLTLGNNLTITIPEGRNPDNFVTMQLANDVCLYWDPISSNSNEYTCRSNSAPI